MAETDYKAACSQVGATDSIVDSLVTPFTMPFDTLLLENSAPVQPFSWGNKKDFFHEDSLINAISHLSTIFTVYTVLGT